jgi:PTS system galactitol-specific IIC component
MQAINTFIQGFLSIGAVSMLPIFITIMGLIFGINFFKALKNGLLVGIGFQGIALVITFLMTVLSPVLEFFGSSGSGVANFYIVDVGWASLAGAAWAFPLAAIVLPVGFLLNFLMIRLKVTRTLNVDVWNYWHFIFSGAIVYYLMIAAGASAILSAGIALVVALACSFLACWIGDKIAPAWQKQFGLEGTTCTTIYYIVTYVPINWLVNKVLDLFPAIDKIDIDPKTVQAKLGPIGEPAILGLLVGMIMALISRQSIISIIQIGVGVAVAIVLLPRMVALLMEGMSPISVAAQEFMYKKVGKEREIYIGMDVALGIGDTTAITASLLLIPITVGLAFILPGNHFFPTATLGAIIYICAIGAMSSGGKLIRTLVMGCAFIVYHLYALNFLAPMSSVVMNASGVVDVPAGTQTAAFALESTINLAIGIIARLFGIG